VTPVASTVATARTAPQERPYVPAWLPITSLLIALVGLGASIYLTYEHFTQNATLACSANSVVDCAAVTTSPQSRVFGIPVAVLGLVFFVGIIPTLLPVAWRMNTKLVRNGRMVASAIGVCFVFYLISVRHRWIHSTIKRFLWSGELATPQKPLNCATFP